jgi:hypothetical protein
MTVTAQGQDRDVLVAYGSWAAVTFGKIPFGLHIIWPLFSIQNTEGHQHLEKNQDPVWTRKDDEPVLFRPSRWVSRAMEKRQPTMEDLAARPGTLAPLVSWQRTQQLQPTCHQNWNA